MILDELLQFMTIIRLHDSNFCQRIELTRSKPTSLPPIFLPFLTISFCSFLFNFNLKVLSSSWKRISQWIEFNASTIRAVHKPRDNTASLITVNFDHKLIERNSQVKKIFVPPSSDVMTGSEIMAIVCPF